MITRENGKYVILSHDGKKRLSKPFSSENDAKKRLRQIEYFKHLNNKGKNYSKKFGKLISLTDLVDELLKRKK
jgi:hypothetical protein